MLVGVTEPQVRGDVVDVLLGDRACGHHVEHHPHLRGVGDERRRAAAVAVVADHVERALAHHLLVGFAHGALQVHRNEHERLGELVEQAHVAGHVDHRHQQCWNARVGDRGSNHVVGVVEGKAEQSIHVRGRGACGHRSSA